MYTGGEKGLLRTDSLSKQSNYLMSFRHCTQSCSHVAALWRFSLQSRPLHSSKVRRKHFIYASVPVVLSPLEKYLHRQLVSNNFTDKQNLIDFVALLTCIKQYLFLFNSMPICYLHLKHLTIIRHCDSVVWLLLKSQNWSLEQQSNIISMEGNLLPGRASNEWKMCTSLNK